MTKLRQTKLNEFFKNTPNQVPIKQLKVDYNSQERKRENTYLLRFDGASKGNPGKAGAGAVLYLNNNEIMQLKLNNKQFDLDIIHYK